MGSTSAAKGRVAASGRQRIATVAICIALLGLVLLLRHASLGTTTPEVKSSEIVHPRVKVETSMGSFVVEVYVDRVPKASANWLGLVGRGAYDGALFFRSASDPDEPIVRRARIRWFADAPNRPPARVTRMDFRIIQDFSEYAPRSDRARGLRFERWR